jgi:hypothetical protein
VNARQWLDEFLDETEEALPIWDDCDAAIVGVASRCATPDAVVYDYRKLIQVFVDQGLTHEEATEYVSFNILGAWIGPNTPLILFTPEDDRAEEAPGP